MSSSSTPSVQPGPAGPAEKQFAIGQTLANQVLNYLANRPWIEVQQNPVLAEMIQGLQSLPEVNIVHENG